MKAKLIISALVATMTLGVVTNAGVLGTFSWPQELQGPTMFGLKPEIYGIWRWDKTGPEICRYSYVARQMLPCGSWVF